MLRYFYTCLYICLSYLVLPFLVLRLWFKSLRQPAYRHRIQERFACFQKPSRKISVWIHAVSLGEVIAAGPLIEKLLLNYPEKNIVLTTTTPTGSQKAIAFFKQAIAAHRLYHYYIPFDAPYFIHRFLKKLHPTLIIIMETELWPNWFSVCHKKRIPIIIANARLSAHSQKGYRRIQPLAEHTLACVTQILAQSREDADRFIQLGMRANHVHVLGNIKFDLKIPDNVHEKAQQFRAQWKKNRPVFIAGSTHPGEEEIILQAFKMIKTKYSDALLILVPRHPERFDKVAEMSEKMGFNTLLRTNLDNSSSTVRAHMDVLLGNTIGEMLLFLAASDVAFIGGSLIPQGGHNILEPAALYVPVITGPQMFNFQKIYDEFVQSESLITVTDATSLAQSVLSLFEDPLLREEYASLGFKIIEKNQGALEKHLKVFNTYLSVH